ncbi:uncharacterized protein LOC124292486 [Haliotis rubra]|uniref:uncharacterized protein LOC124292486 n=1 Tax=Haliotis rubra TaxID=36100 RepID=UPI001EE4EBD7|nr:uncharacterized protein LOC124292486 [Haliotis rubra]
MTNFAQLEHHLLSGKMRFLLLVVIVALTVTDVSGGWWRRLKRWAGNQWRKHKGQIIGAAVAGLVAGRSIDDVDQNGDGVLTRSELQQHMDERDVDELLDMLDENGDGHVRRDVLESYAEEALADSE